VRGDVQYSGLSWGGKKAYLRIFYCFPKVLSNQLFLMVDCKLGFSSNFGFYGPNP